MLINRYLPAIANRCIRLDNANAAQTATKLLIRQGHRRIACVTTDLPIDDRAQRLAGYRQAMAAGGIEVPGSWIISVPFNERGGELAAERVLASDQRFTAAVTFNDVMAAGMMRTCHQRQVQLPEALSIVGFDDIALAKYLHPALTTVHYPIEKMARRAARLALQIHSGSDVAPQNNRFSAELILRDSVVDGERTEQSKRGE